ncbi:MULTISPECIES: hypothetical protein, partial [Gluconobacter]|uniref:hypothetical protein n=1 Tax=Gluconobacter TaxID=441 RepID=UPI001D17BBEC
NPGPDGQQQRRQKGGITTTGYSLSSPQNCPNGRDHLRKPCRSGKTSLEEFNYVPAVALRRDLRDKVIELIDDYRRERITRSLEPPFIREGKH